MIFITYLIFSTAECGKEKGSRQPAGQLQDPADACVRIQTGERGHDRCALQLIEAEVDVNRADYDGVTALMLACEKGHDPCALQLIEAEADFDQTNNEGMTALISACLNGHDPAALQLIKANANLGAVLLSSGHTALMLACQYCYDPVARVTTNVPAAHRACKQRRDPEYSQLSPTFSKTQH